MNKHVGFAITSSNKYWKRPRMHLWASDTDCTVLMLIEITVPLFLMWGRTLLLICIESLVISTGIRVLHISQ
jgi:hypothetical protein